MSASPNNGNNDYELCWLPFIGHGAWQHQHTHTYVHATRVESWFERGEGDSHYSRKLARRLRIRHMDQSPASASNF